MFETETYASTDSIKDTIGLTARPPPHKAEPKPLGAMRSGSTPSVIAERARSPLPGSPRRAQQGAGTVPFPAAPPPEKIRISIGAMKRETTAAAGSAAASRDRAIGVGGDAAGLTSPQHRNSTGTSQAVLAALEAAASSATSVNRARQEQAEAQRRLQQRVILVQWQQQRSVGGGSTSPTQPPQPPSQFDDSDL